MAHSAVGVPSPRLRWPRHLRALLAGSSIAVVLMSCGAAEESGAEPEAVEAATPVPLGQITTYAGSGSPKFKGDDGPATEAGFYAPNGLALDGDGNLYISADNRIRMVDAITGVITTAAGIGRNRSDGDGGPAAEAAFAEPKGLAFDGAGNLFIVENGSGQIRKLEASTGIVTTVAGGGIGDKNSVGDGGPAVEAFIRLPDDVAVDSQGNIFIVAHNRVRRVDAATGIISTLTGTGRRGLSGDGGPAAGSTVAEPKSIAVDAQNNVFFADTDNHRVRKVELATGIITTVAGIGKHSDRIAEEYGADDIQTLKPATGAGYSGDGRIRVRRVDGATGIITTVAGGETEYTSETGKVQVLTTTLGGIESLAVNSQGAIFVADQKNNLVHMVSPPP